MSLNEFMQRNSDDMSYGAYLHWQTIIIVNINVSSFELNHMVKDLIEIRIDYYVSD